MSAARARMPGVGRARSERQRQQRREELVDAAVRVIRRDGAGASMDQFAAEAGVTKPILYRNFGDRAGLYGAVTSHTFERLGAGLLGALHDLDVPPRKVVANAIDTYLAFIESDPELYRFLSQQQADWRHTVDDFIGRLGVEVAVVLGEALRAVGADSGAAEPWAFGIVGMVFAAGDWWLARRTMPRSTLCEYLTGLVCDGLPGIPDVEGPASGLLAARADDEAEPGEPRSTGASLAGSGRQSGDGSVVPIATAPRRRRV